MKKLQNIGAKLSVLPLLLMPASVLAQGNTLSDIGAQTGLDSGQGGSLTGIISGLISVFLGILGIIFFLLTLYAGFLYMTAAGEDDKVDKAKKLLTQAVIGLVIILAAYAISTFVTSSLTTATGVTVQ